MKVRMKVKVGACGREVAAAQLTFGGNRAATSASVPAPRGVPLTLAGVGIGAVSAVVGSVGICDPRARRNPRFTCTSCPLTFASIRTRKLLELPALYLKGPVLTGLPEPPSALAAHKADRLCSVGDPSPSAAQSQ